ncbi:hypothetical protein [Neglectibacter caecimuris]|uniref:hypothetical protein n=1 Tax=Neglectibacter caecimuris TaxID=3093658 RepID=UPI002AC89BC4|nr:hypothetical protein [Neglectibacter sp. M00184]
MNPLNSGSKRYIAAFRLIVPGKRRECSTSEAFVCCRPELAKQAFRTENRQYLTSFQFEEVFPEWIFVRLGQKRCISNRWADENTPGKTVVQIHAVWLTEREFGKAVTIPSEQPPPERQAFF